MRETPKFFSQQFCSMAFPITGRPFSWSTVVDKAFIKYVNEQSKVFLLTHQLPLTGARPS